MGIISFLVSLLYVYLYIGLIFASWFVFSGVNRLDGGMREAPRRLRLLLLPGAAALWIVLLLKYLKRPS